MKRYIKSSTTFEQYEIENPELIDKLREQSKNFPSWNDAKKIANKIKTRLKREYDIDCKTSASSSYSNWWYINIVSKESAPMSVYDEMVNDSNSELVNLVRDCYTEFGYDADLVHPSGKWDVAYPGKYFSYTVFSNKLADSFFRDYESEKLGNYKFDRSRADKLRSKFNESL